MCTSCNAKERHHPKPICEKMRVATYRMTNLRGLRDSTGKRAKQMTKQASAPRLQAPNINNRSHLLTVEPHGKGCKSAFCYHDSFLVSRNKGGR